MQTNWAAEEFQRARVWDSRCRTTLIQACQTLAGKAELSLSRALGSQRKAISRILHHPQTQPDDLLAGHSFATAQRCQQHEFVLVATDTTPFDFSEHRATKGLGAVSALKRSYGFLLHSALALTEQGVPLGILHQTSWSRANPLPKEAFPQGKESDKWLTALRGIEEALVPSQKALVLCDREADLFAFLSAPRRDGVDLLVRATKERPLATLISSSSEGDLTPSAPTTLLKATAQAPVVGHKTVPLRLPSQIKDSKKGFWRDAHLTIRCRQVSIVSPLPPHEKKRRQPATLSLPSLTVSVVQASEENPPADIQEPIHWVLLTSLALPSAEEAKAVFALQMVEFYTFRWRIERFHFVLKSGCRFERLQLDDFLTLQKAVSLYSVVAWRLMYLLYLAREAPDSRMEDAFSLVEQEVLSLATGKSVHTLGEALIAVGQVGGFRPSTSTRQ